MLVDTAGFVLPTFHSIMMLCVVASMCVTLAAGRPCAQRCVVPLLIKEHLCWDCVTARGRQANIQLASHHQHLAS